MGGEHGLVLAAEQVRDLDREATHPYVGGVDDVPLALDVAGLGAVRAQRRWPNYSFVDRSGLIPGAGGGATPSDEHCPQRADEGFRRSAPRPQRRDPDAAGGATVKITGVSEQESKRYGEWWLPCPWH